jgi:hypothetical protein
MRKFSIIGVLLALSFALTAIAEFAPPTTNASSHREAPLISQDPAADNTDTYLFRDPNDASKVVLIANYYPYEGPAGGPNFYRFGDDVRYEFNIDNDGDAKPEIRYFVKFHTQILNTNTFLYNTGVLTAGSDTNLTVKQTYKVFRVENGKTTLLASGLTTPPDYVGTHSIASYSPFTTAAVHTIDTDIQVFAGQRKDPFFADVGSIFDLLTIRGGIPAGFSSGGSDLFARYNVQTIALQIPIVKLTKCKCMPAAGDFDNDVIGVWASASRKATRVLASSAASAEADESIQGINNSSWKQVSRLGLPLVNEAVIPMAMKDKFNASKPVNDVANFAGPVTNPELANLLHALYGVPIPPTPRNDLVQVLLKGIPNLNQPNNVVPSDMLRLNVTTPVCTSGCSTMGVIGGDNQGFPNGRRLTDDVVDIAERVVAGVASGNACCTGSPNNLLGDGVNAPAVAPLSTFPYVPDPLDGFQYAP